ncbi:MAG: response regulator transcription factor, partial [Anaerolineae bacterium]|nr:response regulator transcription factor [Anaerolineae bacterium]
MEPISVMLVDDNPSFLNAAVQFLEACCEEVTVVASCSSGQEALEKARELRPHIILLDMMMPGISGLSIIGPLKQSFPDTAIIALTVMEAPNFRKAALAAGADAFVPKSAMHMDLLPTIRRIVEEHNKKEPFKATPTASQEDEALVSYTVLLMEDDPSQSRLYAKAMRKAGYTVCEAHTPVSYTHL